MTDCLQIYLGRAQENQPELFVVDATHTRTVPIFVNVRQLREKDESFMFEYTQPCSKTQAFVAHQTN